MGRKEMANYTNMQTKQRQSLTERGRKRDRARE